MKPDTGSKPCQKILKDLEGIFAPILFHFELVSLNLVFGHAVCLVRRKAESASSAELKITNIIQRFVYHKYIYSIKTTYSFIRN